MSLAAALITIIVCLGFEIFFSGTEMALISVNRIRLRRDVESGSGPATMIENLLKNPEEIFGTTSIGTNLATVTAVSTATIFLVSLYGERGDLYATLIMAPLILLFGEIIPKSIFQERADTIAYIVIYPFRLAKRLFSPLLLVTSALTNCILFLLTGKKGGKEHFVTRDEIIQLLRFGKKSLNLPPKERKMIHNIFEFRDTTVRECMLSLIDLVALNENNTIDTARKVFMQTHHSRIPIFNDRICQIYGTLNYFDILRADDGTQEIHSLVQPAHFVPEIKRVNELLKEMQAAGVHMAIVVNEYGGTTGIVTIEDMLEEIVGEIQDEYDLVERLSKELPDGSWLIDARMELDALQDHLGIEFPEGEYETLGGFLLDRFQKIPEKGETLTTDGYLFTIMEAKDRAIEQVELKAVVSGQ